MNTIRRALAALTFVLACALGVVCLAAALIAQAGRLDPWLDLLTHFAPVWFAGSLVVASGGLLLRAGRRRQALLVLGVLGGVAAGALMAPELTRPTSPPGPAGSSPTLRLIQFNAWDQNTNPRAAADWIAGQHPDVVAIEEMTPALRRALEARGFVYAKGMVTTAVFSRGLSPTAHFLIPGSDWPILPDFARASFLAPGGHGRFTVVVVHLCWPTLNKFWGQPAAFVRLLERQPRDRLIVVGDLNLTPWSFALARLDRGFGLERRDRAIASWPVMRRLGRDIVSLPAILPIDHIYAGSAWRTVAVRRGPRLGSDHYPIVADLALAD